MSYRRARRGLLVVCAGVAASAVGGSVLMAEATLPVDLVAESVAEVALEVDAGNATRAVTSLGVADMRPGDTTAGVLRVSNTGSVPLRYRVVSRFSNADGLGLGEALVVKVTGASATVDAGRLSRCPGKVLPDTGDRFGVDLVGSDASSRPLGPGATETLCIQAKLPNSAASTLQGAVADVQFEVHGLP